MPLALPPAPTPDSPALVVEAHVEAGAGRLASEPVTVARLRAVDGSLVERRIVGGRSARGGFVHLAGYVVPSAGATVRLDLRATRTRLPGPVTAWTRGTPPVVWAKERLPLELSPDFAAEQLFRAPLPSEVDVAARTWSTVPCSGFRARAGRPTNAPPGDDGLNVVYAHATTWPAELVPGVVAQTVVHTNEGGELVDTDIHLNVAETRYSVELEPGRADLRGVLVHEIGHALGLGHSDDTTATMYATGARAPWRSLEADDRAGVCALYPGRGATGCGDGPCPVAYVCVAGSCQLPGEPGSTCAPCQPGEGACDAAGERAACVAVERPSGRGLVCARACDDDDPCGDGFRCGAGPSGAPVCLPTSACEGLGKTCTTDRDCPGAACLDGLCAGRPDGALPGGPTTVPASAEPRVPPATDLSGGGCTTGLVRGAARAREGAGARSAVVASLLIALGAATRRLGRRRARPGALRRSR